MKKKAESFASELLYKNTFPIISDYILRRGFSIHRIHNSKGEFFEYRVSRNGVAHVFKSDFQQEVFGFLMSIILKER